MKRLRMAANALSVFLAVAGLALLVCLLAAPALLGYASYVVLSGSMSPAIPTGSVVFVAPVAPSTLKVGDVIVYNRSDANERITHRVIEIGGSPGKPSFTTKGDANGAPDPWTVEYGDSAGKVVLSVPYLGYVSSALGSPRGRAVFIILPVVVLSALWLWRIWRPGAAASAPEHEPAAVSAAAVPKPKSASSGSGSLPLRG